MRASSTGRASLFASSGGTPRPDSTTSTATATRTGSTQIHHHQSPIKGPSWVATRTGYRPEPSAVSASAAEGERQENERMMDASLILPLQYPPNRVGDLRELERLPLDLVQSHGFHQIRGAQNHPELPRDHLWDQDLIAASQDRPEIGRQRDQVP